MKNRMVFVTDVLLRLVFATLGTYFIGYQSDHMVRMAGFAILVFNLLTLFFDSNYHKNAGKREA
ncbi:hypothetical protein FPFC_030990 [Fructobacillus pseudoficulneus]|uniref:Uncharacterized protein n=1 Tax=Fructobacillus pseudoficulneus TaxID=220714 RepID=A0A3F3H8K0_9LACO|nr:hypothetical protein [Fructobacillus pseudoficulneus]GAP02919.1 hypothetical protein FPFC_030990 [Fructobacillus pseudoficulneus]SEH46629.1 hypothetical protein SAMN05660469_1394 [Fructobacillus pseudoficulneus]